MKQTSTIGKLVLILGVLLVVILLRDYMPLGKNEVAGEYFQKWNKIEADKITEIAIATEGATLTINKDGSVWKVENYQADGEAINTWLSKLIKPDSPELISENKENQKKLGFEDKPKTVSLKTGENKTVAVTLGNISGTGRYLKFAGEDKVYLVEGLPTMLDSTKIADWVNKTLTKWEQTEIQKLTVERGKTKATLTQTEGKWFVEGKTEEIDISPLSSMLMNVQSLSTEGLAPDQQMTVKAPEVKVTVTTKDGETVMSFSPFKDQDYVVTSSAREGKYLITKSTVDTFKVDPAALQPKPTPPAGGSPSPAPTGK